MRGRISDALALVVGLGLLLSGCCDQNRKVTDGQGSVRESGTNHGVTQVTVIEGVASDAKAGAVVVGKDFIVYIDQLSQWPDELLGKTVRVKGHLTTEKHIPDPGKDVLRQGAWGKQTIMKSASWEEVHTGQP